MTGRDIECNIVLSQITKNPTYLIPLPKGMQNQLLLVQIKWIPNPFVRLVIPWHKALCFKLLLPSFVVGLPNLISGGFSRIKKCVRSSLHFKSLGRRDGQGDRPDITSGVWWALKERCRRHGCWWFELLLVVLAVHGIIWKEKRLVNDRCCLPSTIYSLI